MSSETPSYIYWVGGGLGAITLASVSAIIMWFAEKKLPTIKTIGRDFILGAILFFLLLQLLPESTMTLVTSILALTEATVPEANSIIDSVSSVVDDIELRVGVPNF
jgi:hypothetical protein|uniref:Uncharacterized protein n=1 Tax=viral metagenome TaxID=1070528 RepID=A0A6C0K4K8_9ZZZZ